VHKSFKERDTLVSDEAGAEFFFSQQGLWGDDAVKAIITAAGEKHEAKRQAAKKTIPQVNL